MNTAYLTKLVGVPFANRGRGLEGWDCYGCVRHVLYDQAGLELPSYDLISASDTLRVMRAMQREREVRVWVPVTRARPLDVVLMAHCRRPELYVHVGIMVSATQMLHCEEAAGTHLADVRDQLVEARIRGTFRHHRLAETAEVGYAA